MIKQSFSSDVRENVQNVVDNSYDWFSEQTARSLWEDMKNCTDITTHPEFNEAEGLKICEEML